MVFQPGENSQSTAPEYTILHRAAQPELLYQQIEHWPDSTHPTPPATSHDQCDGCRSAIIVNCEQRYHRLSRAVPFETKATKLPLDSVKRHGARFILLESSAQKSMQHVIPTAGTAHSISRQIQPFGGGVGECRSRSRCSLLLLKLHLRGDRRQAPFGVSRRRTAL